MLFFIYFFLDFINIYLLLFYIIQINIIMKKIKLVNREGYNKNFDKIHINYSYLLFDDWMIPLIWAMLYVLFLFWALYIVNSFFDTKTDLWLTVWMTTFIVWILLLIFTAWKINFKLFEYLNIMKWLINRIRFHKNYKKEIKKENIIYLKKNLIKELSENMKVSIDSWAIEAVIENNDWKYNFLSKQNNKNIEIYIKNELELIYNIKKWELTNAIFDALIEMNKEIYKGNKWGTKNYNWELFYIISSVLIRKVQKELEKKAILNKNNKFNFLNNIVEKNSNKQATKIYNNIFNKITK